MNKVLVVARRELAERWFVFAAAPLLAFAPLLALLAPGGRREKFEAVSLLSLIIALSFVFGLAAILGVSLIGREARERRLSFYLSRPITASQLWSGKLLAAMVLLLSSGAILFAPPFLLYPRVSRYGWNVNDARELAIGLAVCVGILLLLNAASTMLRSRSLWLVVDFAAAALVIVGMAAVLLPLALHGSNLLVSWIGKVMLSALFLAMALAGWAQLARGRVDLRAQHRALSTTLWSVLGAAVLAALAFSVWIRSAGPGDLVGPIDVAGTPQLARVSGRARHRADYRAAFFVAPGGRSTALSGPGWLQQPAFSADGATAAWVEPGVSDVLRGMNSRVGEWRGEIHVARSAAGETNTGIEVPLNAGLAVSNDGARVAVLSATLSIHDVRNGRMLAAVRAPGEPNTLDDLMFLNDGRLRMSISRSAQGTVPGSAASCRVLDFDPGTRRFSEVLAAATPGVRMLRAQSTADGSVIAIWQSKVVGDRNGTASRRLFRARDAREFIDAPRAAGGIMGVGVLGDGRIAMFEADGIPGQLLSEIYLIVYTSEGERTRTIDLGRGLLPRMGGEVVRSKVVVSVETSAHDGTTMLVDVDTGKIENRVRGVLPWRSFYNTPVVPVSTPAEQTVTTRDSVVVWNALTGATRNLL